MVVVDFGDLPADGGDGVTRGSINLGAVLFAVAFVVLVVVGGAAVFLLRKRWRRRGGHGYRSVSTDPAGKKESVSEDDLGGVSMGGWVGVGCVS